MSTTTVTAVVMNSENQALSEYSGYDFNSFAELEGAYLGATQDGIFELTGDQDEYTSPTGNSPIPWKVRTGLSDFGTSLRKVMPYVYVGGKVGGDTYCHVLASERGDKTESWYDCATTRASPDTVRYSLGKGIRSKYLGVELSSPEGAAFYLDTLELMVLPTSRRW